MRPILSSVTLVALILTFLFVGCAKEEPLRLRLRHRRGLLPLRLRPCACPAPAPGPSISQQAFQSSESGYYFDFDKYDLRTDARTILDRKASFLNQNNSIRAQIEGHCDERGTNEYKLALGERRANAAKQYLTTAGISAGRLSTISYGEERPLDPGHSEAAWARNRRAHFVITGQ
jgi:peptidoglycan-associated lipoprotein